MPPPADSVPGADLARETATLCAGRQWHAGAIERLLDGFLSTLGIVAPVFPESQDAAAAFVATGQ
jgi:hypothetical protein